LRDKIEKKFKTAEEDDKLALAQSVRRRKSKAQVKRLSVTPSINQDSSEDSEFNYEEFKNNSNLDLPQN